MKRIYASLICFFAMVQLFAENPKRQDFTAKSSDLSVEVKGSTVDKYTIERQHQTVNSIIDSCNSLKTEQIVAINTTSKDTVPNNTNNLNEIRYFNRYSVNRLLWVHRDSDDIIRKINYYYPQRQLTQEESRFCAKYNNKIPPTLRGISVDSAVQIARKINVLVYGKEESEKFDSVKITEYEATYTVDFKVKQKNNIIDWRRSSVSISAIDGTVESYSGEGRQTVDYSYVPKITREHALLMYNAVKDSLHATIKIRLVGIAKHNKDNGDPARWTWQIIGDRTDKNLGLSAMMFIDSETGEVIVENMD